MNVIFFGSSDFGIPALKRLLKAHTVRAMVSRPPRPQGRGLKCIESPVAAFAQQLGCGPIFTPDDLSDRNFLDDLLRCKADIFIVIAFRILPKALFSLPRLGTINIHASLLPKYRGPAPIQRAIEAGEKETGITVFRIDEGVDTGGILLQKRVPIGPADTAIDLFSKLSDCGADALVEVLDKLGQGTLHPFQQDNKLASRARNLLKRKPLSIGTSRPWPSIIKSGLLNHFPVRTRCFMESISGSNAPRPWKMIPQAKPEPLLTRRILFLMSVVCAGLSGFWR